MPLRPDVRPLYNTAEYRRERREYIEAHGAWCRHCGRSHKYLNLAHLTHDPLDKAHRELLCPSCHAKNDAKQRLAMTRRTRAPEQGWFDPELKYAPFPVRTWPIWLRQLRLDFMESPEEKALKKRKRKIVPAASVPSGEEERRQMPLFEVEHAA